MLLLAGCASAPFVLDPANETSLAYLKMESDLEEKWWWDGYHGIRAIDDHDVPSGAALSLFVKPGAHVVGYSCPGWIFLDSPPTIQHVFEPGGRYVLSCTGEAHIRRATDDA